MRNAKFIELVKKELLNEATDSDHKTLEAMVEEDELYAALYRELTGGRKEQDEWATGAAYTRQISRMKERHLL